MKKILVDLTPILPGGDNGGAKIFVLQLLHLLIQKNKKFHFTILYTDIAINDIEFLQSNNVLLLSVKNYKSVFSNKNKIFFFVNNFKRFNFVIKFLIIIKSFFKRIISSLHNNNYDILFCPFSYPTFKKPNIPIVSIFYDFQFNVYPYFFTEYDFEQRKNTAIKCLSESTIIVCISCFTKNSAINFDSNSKDKLKVIHIERSLNQKPIKKNDFDFDFSNFNPYESDFILYPANFWLHKNHEMLFVSLNMLIKKYPAYSKLVLVCTGSKSPRSDYLSELSISMGLENNIVFTNFINEYNYYNLFSMAKLMIYPSLYEGFGMPIIEAMELGVPIACSDLCSLPEIAGDSAIYFNPKIPSEIANSIHLILSSSCLQDELKIKGKNRIKKFNNADRMADKYTEIFKSVLIN